MTPPFQAQLYHGRPSMADYTNTSNATIPAGTVIVDGATLRITHVDILAGALGSVAMGGGTYKVVKATTSGSAIADGVDVYWDATNYVITSSSNSGANLKFGVTEAASADTDTTQIVKHATN